VQPAITTITHLTCLTSQIHYTENAERRRCTSDDVLTQMTKKQQQQQQQ